MSILEIESLGVRYGRQRVLERVSFRVEPGQVYALLGRNGAGKSSLVRCLLGWQRASEGSARLFGADAWKTRARAMERTGVVPEKPDLPLRHTLAQLEDFCAGVYPRFDHADFRVRLDRAGISRKAKAGSLSRGQAAQAMLALALAPGPELLVLDDPTLGLDAVARRAFWEALVIDLAERGVTVFLTTHDLAGAEGVAERVGILHGGRLVCDAPIEGLKAALRRLRWSGEAGPNLHGLRILRQSTGPFGSEAVVEGWTDDRLRPGLQADPISLEDAFIAWTDEHMEVRA
jgi:ABC-2 type transport system ATP-binding protein